MHEFYNQLLLLEIDKKVAELNTLLAHAHRQGLRFDLWSMVNADGKRYLDTNAGEK